MKWSLNLGKVAGIKLSVHWTFIILIDWMFFMHCRMGHDSQQALMGVVFILALFVCITLHELGQALTKSALYGHTIKDVLMQQFTRLQPQETLGKVVKLLLNGQEREFIVMENDHVCGILTKKELIKGLAEYGQRSPVSNVMRKDHLTLNPGMLLPEIYQKLMTDGCSVTPGNLKTETPHINT